MSSYLAIDLKSFYASVECVERGLDPLNTCLVVADPQRSEKTICLAVSPALKSFGVPGRPRLFEVVAQVERVNAERRWRSQPEGESVFLDALENAALQVSFITAPPRMKHYIQFSQKIYEIYLRYLAPEDMHVYSIDEVFLDVTHYLSLYGCDEKTLAERILKDIYLETGITATAGIGENLYLAKVAMDILAKHMPADANGSRIANLTVQDYRKKLWTHEPLRDFWRVGPGYQKKLEAHGLKTMGDIARCSLGKPGEYYNEDLLFDLFGVNAELLIDHAWGIEPCTISDIHLYQPKDKSVGEGQVLMNPYPVEKARRVAHEMVDETALRLQENGLVAGNIVLTLAYDKTSMENAGEDGIEMQKDYYGRKVPKSAHGTSRFLKPTASSKVMVEAAMELFDQIVNPSFFVRKITVSAGEVMTREEAALAGQQLNFLDRIQKTPSLQEKKDENLQKSIIELKNKFGKNAVLKGVSLEEGATARERHAQIGGHKA